MGKILLTTLSMMIWLALSLTVFAQYQIKSWTTDDGLPQNTIHSIVQTRDGYLWLATLDGLVRFDGVKFTVFNKNNSPGIVSNRFTRMVEDVNGDLWVGTEESGVTRYHDGVFQTYAVVADGAAQTEPLWRLVLDPNGRLVVGSETGVVEWNGTAFVARSLGAADKENNYFFWNRAGAFFYLDGQTLYRLQDGQTNKFTLPGEGQEAVKNPFYEDRRGRLWIGTMSGGLMRLEDDRLTIVKGQNLYLARGVVPQMEDQAGNLWATSLHGAVIVAADDRVSRVSVEDGLSDDVLRSIRQDREGNVWLGSIYRGLNRLSKNSVAFYSVGDGLAANVVQPIFQDKTGDIWLGGGGLTRYQDGRFNSLTADIAGTTLAGGITAIAEDRAGRRWFGFWNGAYYLENGRLREFTARFGQDPTVNDIHEDANGALWFATSAGAFRFQNDVVTRLTTAENLISNNVKIINESANGALWFGTYGGLSKYQNGAFQSWRVADGLASDQIRSLYEDADGTLWIGSYDGGLTRFKDHKFTVYTTGNGLYNDGVFQILEDDAGNFWMSSNRGIYRVAKQQLNDFADGKINHIESIAYGKTDGLLETECNGGQQPAGIKARDGKLWFPTQRGVAVIDPRNIKTNPLAPPIAVESVEIDNEAFPVSDKIEIAPDKNNLQINYTALSFVKPELVTFRYKMEGLDADWVEAGTRRAAYYSYLPPGEYTFQVIAANSDGVWNTDGKTIKISVKPAFYRTWWFLILSLLLIGGAIYLFYRQRINRLETQRRTQELYSRQLLASQETERQRIAAELHDGLGQSLLIIKNRALLGTMSPDDKIESQEQFEEISRASSQAIEEVREIAYNLRPYHLDRLGLTQSIKAMLEAVNDSTAIEFAYDIAPLENIFPNDEEVIVYRIVQESINNIVKHSQATEASVLIHQAERGVTLTIEDNGRGFTPHTNRQTKGGFGLIGLDERVRILGGTLQIRSEPDNGTTIIIKELGISQN